MRTPSPGNRLVRGESGVVFEVPASVASGLVGNGAAQYVEEPQPRRRGRLPKPRAFDDRP